MVVLNEFDARGGRLSSRSGATLLLTGTTCIFTVHSQAFIKFKHQHVLTEKLLFKARLYTGGAGTHTGHTGAHGHYGIAVDGGVADSPTQPRYFYTGRY